MPSGQNQTHFKEMKAQGWEYLPDGRFQHPDGNKEVYIAVAALLRIKEGHLHNIVFFAHAVRDDEPVTEVIAENVYGNRGHRCLSSDANLYLS